MPGASDVAKTGGSAMLYESTTTNESNADDDTSMFRDFRRHLAHFCCIQYSTAAAGAITAGTGGTALMFFGVGALAGFALKERTKDIKQPFEHQTSQAAITVAEENIQENKKQRRPKTQTKVLVTANYKHRGFGNIGGSVSIEHKTS